MRTSTPEVQLTNRQTAVLSEIVRYYEATGEPAGVNYLARRLVLHHETIREHLASLYRKGWLLSETSPATPRTPFLSRP